MLGKVNPGARPVSVVQGREVSLLGGRKRTINLYHNIVRSIRCMVFEHSLKVVYFFESPLLDVSLYMCIHCIQV